MNKLLIAFYLITLTVSGQSGLEPPRLGFIAETDHTLRSVLGLPGNMLLGSSVADDVCCAAWSGTFGLVKTGAALMAFDASHVLSSVDVGPGPALFAFNVDGSPAFALLQQSGTLYSWTGKTFDLISLPSATADGQPLAIASAQAGHISLIVDRADGLWLEEMSSSGDGFSQLALPGIAPPVLLQSDGTVLYTEKTSLVIRAPSGKIQKIETGIPISEMHWMGSGWVHAVEAGGRPQYAVRIAVGAEKISQLPEVR